MPLEVTIVDNPSDSSMSSAEMDWRTSLHLEIVNQLRIKDGRSFTAEKELRLLFGLALSTTDELADVARLCGIVPPPRNF